ncbi:hypothetical protein PHYSODRAFT_494985 [Phytophthora sojae]|uniref:Uncharacterized protein n=1 Tax=Phytophthora sojae (strain P6497) TaxID=1094619 RepID=G4Z6H8_PHYSP|nr:hypothetical protein PHYSODRAFT_494985 [Phytophthora sojae]EGZ22426.1 hypothetical protein PHYSODRAFT_494985 [Phytophthora sojae]|eukprot:XP_009525143.1 hypothetical protein PHYSODRAFT_494985 [Phytophthora sojae]
MVRSKAAFLLLTAIAATTSTQAIDWTFWNDDNDTTASTGSNTGLETLSPEVLKDMMGSDYMDAVNEMALPSKAVSKYPSTYRNWVGPWSQSADSACYREAHIMKTCPSNYDRNDLTNTCWTECPMDYPVECGMQCIQQNNDCGRETIAKVSALAMSILSSASFGVFGTLAKLGKTVSTAVNCVNMMLVAVRAIVRFTRNQMVNEPQTSQEKLLLLLYQTNFVVGDLPAAIWVCQGKSYPAGLRMTRGLLPTAQYILLLVLSYDDDIINSWEKFKAFMKRANFTEAAEAITDGEISSLQTGMDQNTTCGDQLRSLTSQVWMTVNEYREDNPKIKESELRLKLSQSDLMLYDVATVTNNCMNQMASESSVATAYKTRETLRKTYGVIIDDLIKDGKSDNGTSMAAKHNAYVWLDNAITFVSVASVLIDPTDLSTLFAEYLQTICGPTQFMGEIDDGDEAATLGMNALHKAFKNSTLSWTRKGDGAVIINFKSKDTKDVTVNIMSGGDKVDEVDVKAGGTAQWKSNVTALGGKTLYLDRWRPGFLGLPGTGGGSLVMWVPIARDGGHLEVNAQLNVS